MNCTNCGSQVEGKFCPNCGVPAPIMQQEETKSHLTENTPPFDSPVSESMAEQSEVILKKTKMLGNITYKTIQTTVTTKPESVDIKMDIKKIFRKTRTHEKTILLADIQRARVRTVMDFWDALYGIIFAVLGFSAPILFVGTAVCLWCGYGKEVEILLTNGEKIGIPAKSGNSSNALVNLLNKG